MIIRNQPELGKSTEFVINKPGSKHEKNADGQKLKLSWIDYTLRCWRAQATGQPTTTFRQSAAVEEARQTPQSHA